MTARSIWLALVATTVFFMGCNNSSLPIGEVPDARKPSDATGSDSLSGSGGSGTGGVGTGGASGGATGTGGAGGALPGSGGAGGSTDAGSGGTVGTGGAAGTGGTAGTGGNVGTGGTGGIVAGPEITKVVPTAGCGKAPGPTGMQTIATMGTKAANCSDSNCGAWMYSRDYDVVLPAGYNNTKAYPLVFLGPGCAGSAATVYNLDGNAGGTVIRVGVSPPPNAIGHPTNPGVGCFDDREGDDSVDWVLYETLYDRLAQQFCFDQNRVFASGHSSGGSMANELGCKYAGDAKRPIRGVMANVSELPTDPRYVPTCTNKGMAAIWSHSVGDLANSNRNAIARAMMVNKCTIGTNIDNAMFDDFPIGGGNAPDTCKKIRGCPELYPLVVCPMPGSARSSYDSVANPGYATFIKLFSMPPLLTP